MSGISLQELDAQHGELLPEREALGVWGRSFGPCNYHPVDCHHRDFFDHHCDDRDRYHIPCQDRDPRGDDCWRDFGHDDHHGYDEEFGH